MGDGGAPFGASEPLAGPGRRVQDATVRDLQTLLARAVRELREQTGAPGCVAWALREDGSPYVAAASFSGPSPLAPDAEAFALAGSLSAATDLGDRRLPRPLRDLARRFGCAALTPVAASGGGPLAALLLADREDLPRAPRRRTAVAPHCLAALDAAARRLASPLAAALAAGRLRQLDQAVCGLDRLAALGSLATEIAHEVRNPLVSMKTFLQLLPERRSDPEFVGRFSRVVSEELARIERLLDCLVAHGSPPQAEVPETANESSALPAVLGSLAELVRHRALRSGVDLEVSAPGDLPRVAVSEDRLRQVVLNLTLNAIDATPGGGTVALRGRVAHGGVELRVADQGPGIAEENREAVFEPFYSARRERPGGLGLAITRRIVRDAGGRIEISAHPGGGAEFTVHLPSAVRPVGALTRRARTAPATPPSRG